jgi:hypothetical protein
MAAWAAWIIKEAQGWRNALVSPMRNQRGWKEFQPRFSLFTIYDLRDRVGARLIRPGHRAFLEHEITFGDPAADLALDVFPGRGLAGRP